MQPAPEASTETAFHGFSVAPPAGKHWCIQELTSAGAVYLGSAVIESPLDEQPGADQALHSFVVHTVSGELPGANVADSRQLRVFVENWVKGGSDPNTIANRSQGATAPTGKQFEVVQSNVTLLESNPDACVRYASVSREQGNPLSGNADFTLENNGIMCRHPERPTLLVWANFSERYIEGTPNPRSRAQMQAQARGTVRSLQLEPL